MGFRRVYVANRGEIACRVIRALQERGIEAVIGYSEPDRGSMAVALADQAVLLGPGPAAESYLAIPRVIEAARSLGAEAVHPGYGFLSERPAFVRALAEAGMAFVGPSAATMEALGDKVRGRAAARAAQVPVVPGTDQPVSPEAALELAPQVGYPLLVKAAAGGGGRGMRRVEGPGELAEAVRAASREAAASFGDGTVFLERWIRQPRHVEIQVLADGDGNAVHLYERECSVQRRHQKVLEEAPSPVPGVLRELMGEAAVSLVRSVGYQGAATVEFLVSGDEFFFLEVNTRIQVEHPVTEMITGVDLVDAQISIAEGLPLGFDQADLEFRGHAIEARLCAEDPGHGFVPSPGTLLAFDLPRMPGVRVDAGFREGDRVPEFYDSMLAKVIAFGRDREHARRRLVRALEETYVLGVQTNASWLLAILEHPEFVADRADVQCLDRWMADWPGRDRARPLALAMAGLSGRLALAGGSGPGGNPGAGGLGSGSGLTTPWETLGAVRL